VLTAKGIASGMPVAAFIAKESVMDWKVGSHGTTYGGNPVCLAAATTTFDPDRRRIDGQRGEGEGLHLQPKSATGRTASRSWATSAAGL